MIGPIRQELLSGIADPVHLALLKNRLKDFEDVELKSEHFVTAAEISNECRRNGVAGSATDFLICSVSMIEKLSIFTADKDCESYARVIELTMYRGT